ncbi:MAG: hypothetical protein HY980_02825 [Candidatus Magasanikbacteria bacterium]|nr:hypothetical protein [Candidatus Magasanikbacteria bacterium]
MLHGKNITSRWQMMTLAEQMGNIGSEFGRTTFWLSKDAKKEAEMSLARLLELLDLSIADLRWTGRRGEFLRLRELVCDVYHGGDFYNTTGAQLNNYFLPFAILARKKYA